MSEAPRRDILAMLQEYSVSLLAGVVAAMLAANLAPAWYDAVVHWRPFGGAELFGHAVDLQFLVSDIFTALFFGIAAVEITRSCLPGGDLVPPAKAMNPLIATIGGVVGPVAASTSRGWAAVRRRRLPAAHATTSPCSRTAGHRDRHDIALAWLVARTVFGRGHPAIPFRRCSRWSTTGSGSRSSRSSTAIPPIPCSAGVPRNSSPAARALAYALRRLFVASWVPTVVLAGPLAWAGPAIARLHPALALVCVVPFLSARGGAGSPLARFEHQLKPPVDLGLFFFAFTRAGVTLADVGPLTWLVLGSLVIGKTVGIAAFGGLRDAGSASRCRST